MAESLTEEQSAPEGRITVRLRSLEELQSMMPQGPKGAFCNTLIVTDGGKLVNFIHWQPQEQ